MYAIINRYFQLLLCFEIDSIWFVLTSKEHTFCKSRFMDIVFKIIQSSVVELDLGIINKWTSEISYMSIKASEDLHCDWNVMNYGFVSPQHTIDAKRTVNVFCVIC